MPAPAVITILVSLLGAAPATAAWRWPVDNEIERVYAYSARSPFAAGQRRGVDLAARPGSVVVAACAGRVAYAGPVPGRGFGVSVRCGRLVATHLGLGRTLAARGAFVHAGAAIGTAGRAGLVRLGARRASDRFAYVDPRGLIGREPRPLGPAPAPRSPSVRIRARRAPPAPQGAAPPAGVPLAVWAGLGLLAFALPASVARRWGPSTSPRRSTTSTRRRTWATRTRRSRPT